MADAYRELNLHPEALAAYESAIRHFATVSVDYERARAEMGRASVLAALSRTDEALEGAWSVPRRFSSRTRTVCVRRMSACCAPISIARPTGPTTRNQRPEQRRLPFSGILSRAGRRRPGF